MFDSDYVSKESHKAPIVKLGGVIRWDKSIGRPPGNPCYGFTITVLEHIMPRTSGGQDFEKRIEKRAQCEPAPDEGDEYLVKFDVPEASFNDFPEGYYSVEVKLKRDNWPQPLPGKIITSVQRRIVALSPTQVQLTEKEPIAIVEFRVIDDTVFDNT
jgi:hypothetical protein